MDKMTTEKIREMLCREIDEIAEKGELSAGDLETLHKLTDTVKNIDKIDMLEEYSEDDGYGQAGYGRDYGRDDGYGQRRYSRADEMSYERGNSYAPRGQHYVRGHYSRAEAQDQIMQQLEQMANDKNIGMRYRETARKAMQEMNK